MLTYGVDDFGVRMFGGVTSIYTEHGSGRDIHESAPIGSIESPNECDGDTIAVNQSCRSRIDPGGFGELHRQNLTLGDRAVVIDAWELADAQNAIFVDDRTFGSQAAQRSSTAAKVRQVLCRFRIGLDRATGRPE